MKIGILGSGMVGSTLATKLVELGHEVMMGSRTTDNKNTASWVEANGPKASHGTFDEAARFGEMVFLCIKGDAALNVLKIAQKENLDGKILVDVTNPLKFSNEGLSLFVSNTDSLGEQIQRAVPKANVVKTLNTIPSVLMTEPDKLGDELTAFVCGNSQDAKNVVMDLLRDFGWKDIIDVGDITGARGVEMLLPLWVRLIPQSNDSHLAWKVVRRKDPPISNIL